MKILKVLGKLLVSVDGKWRSVWNSSGSIPDKVKFEIRSSQRYWPDLIMRVSG